MDDNTLNHLDFFRLLDLIKSYISTPYAEEEILNLGPIYEIERINERQEILNEVYEAITIYGKPPIVGTPDIRETLKKLSVENSVLDPKEFLQLSDFLEVVQNLSLFLKKVPSKGRFLTSIVEKIDPLTHLVKRIRKTVNREGFVEDGASYDLLEIRRELHIKRQRVKRHLETLMESERFRNFLQDNYITIRNGRYVIPMKPNFNQAINGIVHDYSHTLKTSFVEPIECVPLNNEINMLEKREKEEVERILKELTAYVNGHLGIFHKNLEAIRELDFFCALSLFAKEFECVRPYVTEKGDLYIEGAINPLLRIYKGDGVVPIDLILEESKSCLIISGPNAGGKTVALKTMGLLLLMAYSGMFIPARGRPKVPLFRKIYALTGDEQDLSRDLSSFTSHILTIKEIFEESKGGELILVDEIGGGTDPREASALSMGIIDAFVEKGCKIVVTTHLSHLKGYGFTKDFAKNAACAYDTERMRPLYRLIYGTFGMSNALEVAKNVGLPESIIEKSLNYLEKQEQMISSLVESLKRERDEAERQREELERLKSALKKRMSVLEQKKDEILKRFEERQEKRMAELEERIKEVEEEISKREKASLKRAKEMAKKLRQKDERGMEVEKDGESELKVGDLVRIKTLNTIGYISEKEDSSGEYEVVIGNIRTRIPKGNLIKVDEGENRKKGHVDVHLKAEKMEEWKLNVRGMNVDEAIERLDRFIDRAVLEGVNRVRIVHGIGTGRLMLKVKEYLLKSEYVNNFKLDEKNPGVTVVELK